MKAVMMLQFSATKFPFAKYFGLKDFFFVFIGNHVICCAATQGIALRCTQPFSAFVCVFAYVAEQVGGKGYICRKKEKYSHL